VLLALLLRLSFPSSSRKVSIACYVAVSPVAC
jgi:hypothetical protein